MYTKICVSLAESNYDSLVSVIDKIQFAEIRLDLCKLKEEEIASIFSLPKMFIATCREGCYDISDRKELLKSAIRAGAQYVDIETEAPESYRRDLVDFAHQYSCKVIISYHNFEYTPNLESLNKIIKECRTQGADLVKLVTTAKTVQDSSRVLSLYDNHDSITAFAMGQAGKITRVAAIFLGAPFTYAAVSEDKIVAGGQLTVNALEQIRSLIYS